MCCLKQDSTEFEYKWSCLSVWADADIFGRPCTNAAGNPLAELDRFDHSLVQIKPRELGLRKGAVYEFRVVVRAASGSSSNDEERFVYWLPVVLIGYLAEVLPWLQHSCYTPREASDTVKIEIAAESEKPIPPLAVMVCSGFPCHCSDVRARFNCWVL